MFDFISEKKLLVNLNSQWNIWDVSHCNSAVPKWWRAWMERVLFFLQGTKTNTVGRMKPAVLQIWYEPFHFPNRKTIRSNNRSHRTRSSTKTWAERTSCCRRHWRMSEYNPADTHMHISDISPRPLRSSCPIWSKSLSCGHRANSLCRHIRTTVKHTNVHFLSLMRAEVAERNDGW